MDVGTGMAVFAGAVGTKELILKVLGPTAEYVGEGLKDFTKRKTDNVTKIFEKAAELLPAHDVAGAVPPRVLKEILDEGSYVEDDLTASYLAGILAASKSNNLREDRGISALKLIQMMSTFEIRAHFLLYQCVRAAFVGTKIQVSSEADKMALFVPHGSFFSGMELPPNDESTGVILSHSIVGLNEKGLIQNYVFGSKEFLVGRGYPLVDTGGIVFTPTPLGAQLFLLASGIRNKHENGIVDREMVFRDVKGITISSGFVPIRIPEKVEQ